MSAASGRSDAASRAGRRRDPRRPRHRSTRLVSPLAIALLAVGIGLTVLATILLRQDIARAQATRLADNARATTNIFSTVTQSVSAVLTTGGVVADSMSGSPDAFTRAVGPRLGPTLLSNAVLFDVSHGAIRELAWVGRAKPVLVGGFTSANRTLLLRAAGSGVALVVAHREQNGVNLIGIATAAHPKSRYAVYGEIPVPAAISFGNLKSVQFAFYVNTETPANLLATNARHLPIGGHRIVTRLDETGLGQQPLLVYADTSGLSLASIGPWLLLAIGLLLSSVLAAQFEAMRRRRDTALALVVDLETKNLELDGQAALNRHQALHDALTGLPNRTLFRDRIEQAVLRGRRTGEPSAVFLIDLDGFKEVNDTFGHESGDLLLRALGERLAASVRESDTVARLGGDEFGVLASPVSGSADALAIAEKLREALSGPAEAGDILIEVDASVGIALYPVHSDDVDGLMRHADIALYRSKAIHAPVVYAREHDHYSPMRLRLLADLRNAIEQGEIVVHYQPQAPTETGVVESLEALVRWQHPELGLIPPDQFIPLAEHTGMIRALTRHVLDTALAQCRAWRDRGWSVGVAVNVCARDLLDSAFPGEVLGCLERAGVDPESLELEITEATILTDSTRAYSAIDGLRARGIRFAIDDFGAGHSSISYLRRLPVQVLKIDKSFVLGMTESPDDAIIVQSTIDLGHNLRLKVVAEGVETEEAWRKLAALGCDMIQGFRLSRPLPAAEIEKLFGPQAARSPATRPFPRAVPELG